MQTILHGSHSRPLISQAEKNTTLWIGHLQTDPTDHFGGQTFTCPSDGILDNVQLYASAVQQAGDMLLTLHEFDETRKIWGAPLGESCVSVEKKDHDHWLHFHLPNFIPLKKDGVYGFRVKTRNAMIGLGEAVSDNNHPFTFGREWNGDSQNERGFYYSYFSLAFKIELRA